MIKFLNGLLDTLLFVVPFMELTEIMPLMPPEYLPWYMLTAAVIRRLVRVLEDYLIEKGKRE